MPKPHALLPGRQGGGRRRPAGQGVLLDNQGFVTEASTANVLIYNVGEGLVAPPSTKILRGISQSVVMELAGRLGIRTTQRNLTTDDLAAADEVFLTSTPMCLLPVTAFNGRPIGAGRPARSSTDFWQRGARWSAWISPARRNGSSELGDAAGCRVYVSRPQCNLIAGRRCARIT